MDIITILFLAVLIFLTVVILIKLSAKNADAGLSADIEKRIDFMDRNLNRMESVVNDGFKQNREELAKTLVTFQQTFLETLREISRNQTDQLNSMREQNERNIAVLNKTLEDKLTVLTEKNEKSNKDNRDELNRSFVFINDRIKERADENNNVQKEQNALTIKQLEAVTTKLDEKLNQLAEQFRTNTTESRAALDTSLKEFRESFSANVKEFNDMQKLKFDELNTKQGELVNITEQKLEKMRETVDEKLQKTLETRLGQSFELVSKQLESVQKGLGEMQTLASDVGGLKRVLSNVKTRGVMGEIQLGNILEQIMAPEQYQANVKTKKTSGDFVEFAIKLPGRDIKDGHVYLPIDAKFPQEAYHLLQIAYDEANPAKVEEATKTLATSIRKFAKDIRDKYLDPPFTTDFGIMFLPIEGLYAEVVRNTDLIEQLQREFKIIITGPTTLAAILNSLQMGFKTLAIQQRSSEVWQILGEVKTEFGKFGGILEKAQKKITEAGNEIDTLVGSRTRAIERKLRKVHILPSTIEPTLLDEGLFDDESKESEESEP
jgi:DNA recombination protein RmuC